ncbi:kinase domain-containing protein [Delphinella strobiligena]|nr:kinase domain-containing protein [Delphinella strobiligena]
MLSRGLRTTAAPLEMIGSTGRRYHFKELIQERTLRPHRYVLKDIPRNIFANFNEIIQPRLPESPYIRLPFDHIPEQPVLVYRYLTDDFNTLVKKEISNRDKRKILKAALQGLAEMHAKDIVHLDIKPDNIMVDCRRTPKEILIENVQISDLENAAYLPKGRCIKDMLPGNDSWRSPEGHFKGELNKPSDIFSFGIMCIYTMLQRVIFGIADDFRKHERQGALPYLIHLQRQICYFGDTEGVYGLMKHIGDDEISCQVLQMLWEERDEIHLGYPPFSKWPEVQDTGFKNIIRAMMNLDPAKRITAVEALEHPWFADI